MEPIKNHILSEWEEEGMFQFFFLTKKSDFLNSKNKWNAPTHWIGILFPFISCCQSISVCTDGIKFSKHLFRNVLFALTCYALDLWLFPLSICHTVYDRQVALCEAWVTLITDYGIDGVVLSAATHWTAVFHLGGCSTHDCYKMETNPTCYHIHGMHTYTVSTYTLPSQMLASPLVYCTKVKIHRASFIKISKKEHKMLCAAKNLRHRVVLPSRLIYEVCRKNSEQPQAIFNIGLCSRYFVYHELCQG